MPDVLIPPDIVPTEESVEVVDDATAVFRPIFGGGLIQRVQQAAPRIRVTQKWRALRGSDLARMQAVCMQVGGKLGSVRAAIGNQNRGTFPSSEWLSVTDFSAYGNWGVGAPGGASATDNTLSVIISSYGAAAVTAYADHVTPPTSSAFVFRSFVYPGYLTQATSLGSGMSLYASGANLQNAQVFGGGYTIASAISSGAIEYRGYCRAAQRTWQNGEGFTVAWGSMRPCLMVSSAAASGATQLMVKAGLLWTGNNYSVLAVGDMFEINNELKKVTQPFNTASGGWGPINFYPPLVGDASINDPVICSQPMGKFILADNPKWSNQFGVYADLELTLEEIYEP